MVRPYEEIKGPDPKRVKTLFELIAKYIKDAYKQFKWEENIIVNEKIQFLDIKSYSEAAINIYIYHDLSVKERYLIQVQFIGQGQQTFSISSDFPPKEIAKTAQNIFKWVKLAMKNI